MVVWLAVSLAALIAVVALAMDGGRLLAERQHMQATADASALAAAGVLYNEYPTNGGLDSQGNARNAALQMATANGVTNGTNGTVTVNIPPLSGDFAGQSGYAEVIVTDQLDRSFSLLFRAGGMTVSGRAVARGIMTGQVSGVYALGTTGAPTLHIHDQTQVNVANAPVYVNNSANNAVQIDNAGQTNGGSISASSFNIVGAISGTAGATTTPTGGQIKTGTTPVQDPLASLPVPSTSGVPVQSTSNININGGTRTLSPGIYQGGITIQGGANVTLLPGVYIIQGGGLAINGNGTTVQGTGVMIYNTGPAGAHNAGAINWDQNGTVSLSPPTSGPYTGISIFQDRLSNQNLTIQFNYNKTITGAIYAPAAPVQLKGVAITPGKMPDILGSTIVSLTLDIEHGICQIGNTTAPPPPKSLYGLVA
jgi:hypothetical protein